MRYTLAIKREGGVSMFDDTMKESLRNLVVGLGLTIVVVGAALAVAFQEGLRPPGFLFSPRG